MLSKSDYSKLSKEGKNAIKKASIKGSGKYIFDKKKNPYGHYGEKIGKALGGYIPFGRQLGAYGGHAIGKLLGSGAYYNNEGKYIPSYKGAHQMIKGSGEYGVGSEDRNYVKVGSSQPPSFGSNRTIVKHREFIGSIISSTGFSVNKFNINPGDEATFPWLSSLAQNYEKYRPLGIVFEYISTSANALNSTNTALGNVMMLTRYNGITGSAPSSELEFLNSENAVTGAPSENIMSGVELAKNFNPLDTLYIRTGLDDEDGKAQWYDIGDFYIATNGMQAADVIIGKLYVTYEIELLSPVLRGGQVGEGINFSHYILSSPTITNLFNGASDSLTQSNMPLTFGTNTLTLPESVTVGNYILVYRVSGTAANTSEISVSYVNAQALNISFGNTLPSYASIGASVNTFVQGTSFTVTGPSATLTFSGGAIPTLGTTGEFYVMQIPGNIV